MIRYFILTVFPFIKLNLFKIQVYDQTMDTVCTKIFNFIIYNVKVIEGCLKMSIVLWFVLIKLYRFIFFKRLPRT